MIMVLTDNDRMILNHYDKEKLQRLIPADFKRLYKIKLYFS